METAESRPARKQVDAPVTGYEHSNDLATMNIWDGRRQRAHRPPKEGRGTKIKTDYKCHPALDSGWTRGERAGCFYCCLYFARGICHHGHDCNYLHRVPSAADETRHRAEPQYDIFGRDRLDEERGTKGAGNISHQVTTLYIYLGGAATQPQELLLKALRESFQEWGDMDDVKVIPQKAIAFVRYQWRSSAEFAKAAMHQQSLKGVQVDHVLDVRWANDDSNPRALARVKREQEEMMAKAYLDAISNADPQAKRARLHELSLSGAYRPDAAASSYPNTNEQYSYEGWDVRAHAEGSQGEDGNAVAVQDDAIKKYEEAIWGKKVAARRHEPVVSGGGAAVEQGVEEEEEDDINRYLPLSDDDGDAAIEYAEELTEPPLAPEKEKEMIKTVVVAEVVKQQGEGEEGEIDALQLLGGYGDSEEDE